MEQIFNSEFYEKLHTLRMSIALNIASGQAGGRKSNSKGNSVEFSDFREYMLGDDIRRIDWNAYGRFDRLFVKLFMEEKEEKRLACTSRRRHEHVRLAQDPRYDRFPVGARSPDLCTLAKGFLKKAFRGPILCICCFQRERVPSQEISKEFTFMAVKIRLARHGAKKRPYYRVVVADARARRDGRFIEEVGRYNPCVEPSFVKFDEERLQYWLGCGAQPTDTVARLIKQSGQDA